MSGYNAPTWIWCLRCERCYRWGEYRLVGGRELCPYDDCTGYTGLEAYLWPRLRERYPEYPELPERKVRYPIFAPR